ncbi:PREDICTED: uncharacterized protein LOC107351127 [Acropora digitifera]|uniref:uncharacterized protein LOC107351127 n=1 Tax=Acropora digitifera TaxID=70779 RepID=UPI00077A4D8E|nr:PREDICTED: uncharacterized protein LOC107351127 [Acropora digitifera]
MTLVTTGYNEGLFTITSMAIHRCYVITHPWGPKLKRRKALIWVSLVWLIAFTLTIPIIIVKKPTQDGECREVKEFEPSIYHHIDECSVFYSTYHNSDLLHKNLALLTSTTRVPTKKIENKRKLHSCVNPIVHGIMNKQYRQSYIKFLSPMMGLCCHRLSTEPTVTTRQAPMQPGCEGLSFSSLPRRNPGN